MNDSTSVITEIKNHDLSVEDEDQNDVVVIENVNELEENTSPDDSQSIVSTDDDCSNVDESINTVRRSLDELKTERIKQRALFAAELMECLQAYENLRNHLCNRLLRMKDHHIVQVYRSELKRAYNCGDGSTRQNHNSEVLPPLYVFKQQIQLCQTMHLSFTIYPKQIELIKEFQKPIASYLEDQLQKELLESKRCVKERLECASMVAAKNQLKYDHYQLKIKDQEQQIRKLRREISTVASCSSNNNKKDNDDCSQGNDDSTVEISESNDEDPLSFDHGSRQHPLKKLAESWTSFVQDEDDGTSVKEGAEHPVRRRFPRAKRLIRRIIPAR